jgi:hypothetical protein
MWGAGKSIKVLSGVCLYVMFNWLPAALGLLTQWFKTNIDLYYSRIFIYRMAGGLILAQRALGTDKHDLCVATRKNGECKNVQNSDIT